MPSPGRLVAFAASRDLARAQRFYTEQLGLTLVEANPGAVVLDSDGVQLRLTLVAEKVAAPHTVLGWDVDDLTAVVAQLRARGVTFNRYPGMDQDGDDAWTAPDGTKVAWFSDPDGNVLSLSRYPH